MAEFRMTFQEFDADGSGEIDSDELASVMKKLGEKVTPEAMKNMIKEVDTDGNGTVSFTEFIDMIQAIREGKTSGFSEIYTKHVKLNMIAGSSEGTQHSFADEEKISFVDHINSVLQDDPFLTKEGIIPIDPESMKFFDSVQNGVLLCKLINWAVPGTIDERAINTKGKLNIYKMTENQNLVLNSAKAIGCNVINVGAQDLIDGAIHLVLALVWQIVKIGITASVNLKSNPHLVALLHDGESLTDFMKLSPEDILLRWMNFHLNNSDYSGKEISNFGPDIKDSIAYTYLLNEIAPKNKHVTLGPLSESNVADRAESMLCEADKLNCRKFVRANDVVKGQRKLNLAYVANLFNNYPALAPPPEEIEGLDELFDNEEDSREERAFRMWINSLGVDPEVSNIFDDLQDGLILLQLIDKVKPGIVVWSRVNKKPNNKFKKLENCQYALELAKDLRVKLIGIGPEDIVSANKKLILAVVWQLMRIYTINLIQSLSTDGKPVTDSTILTWANNTVQAAGKSSSIANFKDKSLSNCVFLLDLLDSCQPGCVDYDVVYEGANDDELRDNARYALSLARKIGISVFALWEDLVEVKQKMITITIAAIMSVYGRC
eukprot:TRINITY_DN41372_c0_g1_i1.p1 TRINITY_DN41372_c0_g1~~TRINITY_DN41372_c0_g1_i1.p1  ORF type:complete len:617 (-),score=277.55 TRINITY_DN41372_c0_g1_i1:70-1884(-)